MPLEMRAMGTVTVDRLKAMFYGQPGVGKTTLALTAERPFVLDFEGGFYRAANAGRLVDGKPIMGIPVKNWAQDVGGIVLRDLTHGDLSPFSTIIIDTVGAALDCLAVTIKRQDRKMRQRNGTLTQPGWGELKERFRDFILLLEEGGKDVVMVAHSVEKTDNGEMVHRIQAAGSSEDFVKQQSSMIGRIWIENGQRHLSFEPQFAAIGKNMGLPTLVLPDVADNPDLLAQLFADAKRYANSHSPESRLYFRILETTEAPDDMLVVLNELVGDPSLPPIREWTPACQRLMNDAAKRSGLAYDREEGVFVQPAPEATETTRPPTAPHADPDLDGPYDEETDDEETEPFEPEPERELAPAGSGLF